MRKIRHFITTILPVCGMLILILDSKTAIYGAAEGISLCIRSVIPALFPFILLSNLLISAIFNDDSPFIECRINSWKKRSPVAILFITGLLGGYPTGANAVAEAYSRGQISKDTAKRLLGFCSNAGPAFIFGIMSHLFSRPSICWLLWGIHILSALAVSILIPAYDNTSNIIKAEKQLTLQQAFNKALHTIAAVCGWIVLFRILITFADSWFLWLFPSTIKVLLSGIMELTNGIILLESIESEPVRFICSSILLSFGGLCVGMQTASVTRDLGTGWYFPGKLMQSAISGAISLFLANKIYYFPGNRLLPSLIIATIIAVFVIILTVVKFSVAFSRKNVYNDQKNQRSF